MGSNPTTVVLRPSFFKPLINDYSTILRLPIGFVWQHQNFLPENAILRIRTGKIWHVKIEKSDDDEVCFFTEGWNDFVRDLELRDMQMLVFWLNIGEATFDVSVYEANSKEREFSAVDFPGSSIVDAIDLEESDSEGECGDESRPRFEFVLTQSQRSRMVLPKKFAMAAGLNGKSGVVLQYPPQERYWPAILQQGTSLDLSGGWVDFIFGNGLVFGRSYSFEFDFAKNLILVSICRKSLREPSASAVKTWRFVKELKQHHFTVQRMDVPKSFMAGTGIAAKNNIVLEDAQGRRWAVTITDRNIGVFSMTRGWADFLRGNNLQVGTVLLFEFVPNSDELVKVLAMENEAGKEMLVRGRQGGIIRP